MRMILGLDRPDAGSAWIDGKRYSELQMPSRSVGAMLETGSRQPDLTAWAHLSWQAASARIAQSRIDEVLELTGLTGAARKRIGSFSLGMRQRLGLASALLGDPDHLILDEPVNGLDPQGVQWIRSLLKDFAERGRTVFISSHLLSEMEALADRIVVIGQGRLIAESSMADLKERARSNRSTVVSPRSDDLAKVLKRNGGRVERTSRSVPEGELTVLDLPASRIGDLAANNGLPLHLLSHETVTLERAFMDLTAGAVEFEGVRPASPKAQPPTHVTDGGMK